MSSSAHNKFLTTIAVAAGLTATTLAFSQAQPRVGFTTPAEMVWNEIPSAPPGVRAVLLAGDPSKPGPYTIRVRLPANTLVLPHFHEDTRYVTILSGHWATAAGDTYSESAMIETPPMSFYIAPARQSKYHINKTEAVIQVSGMGPTKITYVNPADDPRAKK